MSNEEFASWWGLLKGNYDKGVHAVRHILKCQTEAEEFVSNPGAMAVVFGFDEDNACHNDAIIRDLVRDSPYGDKALMTFLNSSFGIAADNFDDMFTFTDSNDQKPILSWATSHQNILPCHHFDKNLTTWKPLYESDREEIDRSALKSFLKHSRLDPSDRFSTIDDLYYLSNYAIDSSSTALNNFLGHKIEDTTGTFNKLYVVSVRRYMSGAPIYIPFIVMGLLSTQGNFISPQRNESVSIEDFSELYAFRKENSFTKGFKIAPEINWWGSDLHSKKTIDELGSEVASFSNNKYESNYDNLSSLWLPSPAELNFRAFKAWDNNLSIDPDSSEYISISSTKNTPFAYFSVFKAKDTANMLFNMFGNTYSALRCPVITTWNNKIFSNISLQINSSSAMTMGINSYTHVNHTNYTSSLIRLACSAI